MIISIITRSGSFLLFLYALAACSGNHMLKNARTFPDYPSASGIEYYNDRVYIIGDDATQLLVLDSNLTPIDSIMLYPPVAGKRMPKQSKPDLEAITLVKQQGNNRLLLTGSGSLPPYRNKAWLIDPARKQTERFDLDTFYRRLQYQGVEQVNIEGSCSVPGSFILSNRGHKAYPRNFLVITNPSFWNRQATSPIHLLRVGANTDSSVFRGVSGLAYAPKSDRLVLTVSTEDTRSVYDDGAIGKSFLWIIQNISSKKRWGSVNPDMEIDLEAVDRRFRGQKIESVCVVKETKHFLHLLLAADNDNGSSTIFNLWVEKR